MGAVFEGKFIFTEGSMTSEQFDLIDKIVKGKKVVLDADFYPMRILSGGIIALMDVWEETSSPVIQRNFIIARYNPDYRICKNVLMRQYDEYELQIINIFKIKINRIKMNQVDTSFFDNLSSLLFLTYRR